MKNKIIKAYAVSISVVVVLLIVTLIYYYNSNEKNKGIIEQLKAENEEINADDMLGSDEDIKSVIKSSIESGTPMLNILRELYPEEIVVYSKNKFDFIPVEKGLKKNDINNDDLKVDDNGIITYEKDGEIKSHKGIDVSKFQGDIDWNKVAADGVEFAIIRVGYRGYGTGAIVEDKNARVNIEGAVKAGIKVGVYFFSQAITKEEAVEEANFVLNIIKDYDIKYPVVFDTEDILNEKERTEGLTKEQRTDITIAFCETVEKAGYTPVVYANLRWFAGSLDVSKLEKYHKWFAYYDKEIYFPYKISMWQYSETGTVNGITGTVDMNISFEDWD